LGLAGTDHAHAIQHRAAYLVADTLARQTTVGLGAQVAVLTGRRVLKINRNTTRIIARAVANPTGSIDLRAIARLPNAVSAGTGTFHQTKVTGVTGGRVFK